MRGPHRHAGWKPDHQGHEHEGGDAPHCHTAWGEYYATPGLPNNTREPMPREWARFDPDGSLCGRPDCHKDHT